MDTGKKLLLISFSSVPAIDRHSAFVTGAVRGLGRLFEEVDVVAIKGDYLAHIERYYGSRLLRVPLVGETMIERTESFRRAVRRQIDSDTYDVVHVRSPLEGVPICEARVEKEFQVVYEAGTFAVQDALGADLQTDEVPALESQMLTDEVACAEAADLVLVHSEAARQTLRKRNVTTPIEVIPGGVNIDAFDWELTADPPVPTLLVLGTLAPWRDVTGVLTSMRQILEVMPVELRWVGEPDPTRREVYTVYAEELGIGSSVSFEPAPEAAELTLLISAASMCLAPASATERFLSWGDLPTGLLEFMACRQAVVAARTSGIEEIVRDGTEALLYTPGDSAGLTSAVMFLLKNPRHCELLAKRGYRRVREQYSESAQRRILLEAYRELCDLDGSYPVAVDTVDEDVPGSSGASRSDELEPITAVMETAEESRRARVDDDTRRVGPLDEDEEHFDTQPHIEVKATDGASTDGEPWVIPETTPHANRPPGMRPSPPPAPSSPGPVEVEDTSRISHITGGRGPSDDE